MDPCSAAIAQTALSASVLPSSRAEGEEKSSMRVIDPEFGVTQAHRPSTDDRKTHGTLQNW
jgi:hypothetical protein